MKSTRRAWQLPALLLLTAACAARGQVSGGAGRAPRGFVQVEDRILTPPEVKAVRPEVVRIGSNFFVGYLRLLEGEARFELLVLDEGLRVVGVYELFSGRPWSRNRPTDQRMATDGRGRLWYPFETTSGGDGEDGCNHLSVARYRLEHGRPVLDKVRDRIARGRPVILRPDGSAVLPDRGDEMMDDPLPVVHRGRYLVLTRRWETAVFHVRVLDESLQDVEAYDLDMERAVDGRSLSVSAFVRIGGRPWIIGGAFDGPPSQEGALARIAAIPLHRDLRSVALDRRALWLTDDCRYENYVAGVSCDGGSLYVVHNDFDGQRGETGAILRSFDVGRGFRPLAWARVNGGRYEGDDHVTLEVVGDRIYVFHPTPEGSLKASVYALRGRRREARRWGRFGGAVGAERGDEGSPGLSARSAVMRAPQACRRGARR